jgi:subtilisin family serine protease
MVLAQVDQFWRQHQEHEFESSAPAALAQRVRLVAEGDSWFDFPPGVDVIDALRRKYGYDIRNLSKAGACLYEMAYPGLPIIRDPNQLETTVRAIRDHRPQAVLLSGGGNDFAGPEFIMTLHHRLAAPTGLNTGVVSELFRLEVEPAYRVMIEAFTAVAEREGLGAIPILVHGYDYAYPDGRQSVRIGPFGFGGPWMHQSFVTKGYALRNEVDLLLRHSIVRRIIDELYAMHERLAADYANVRVVDLRGLLPDRVKDWNDELHPSNSGFEKVATRFHEVLQRHLNTAPAPVSGGILPLSVGTASVPLNSADGGNNAGEFIRVPMEVRIAMDPRLQFLALADRAGMERRPTASSDADEVAVIARVKDANAWRASTDVRAGAVIAGSPDDEDAIVTGRIPLERIEAVRADLNVLSLKAGLTLAPKLEATTREVGLQEPRPPVDYVSTGGEGVIVGIIDYGCDFAHLNFRRDDGSTRLLALWDQNGRPSPSSPFGYGRLHTPGEINTALQQADPYAALGYGPHPSERNSRVGAHGTHVMDIAAGNGRGSGVAGCAPAADLVFVEVGARDIPYQGPEVLDSSFGDSVELLEAILFIVNFARERGRPCVINVSLGTNGGPHDGTTLFEQGVDRLLRQHTNCAVVIAAANAYADGIHASATVPAFGTHELVWETPNSFGDKELEVWTDGSEPMGIELHSPAGDRFGPVAPGESATWALSNGNVAVILVNRQRDPNNGHSNLGVFLGGGLMTGNWRVRLQSKAPRPIRFHAWIERLDRSQSRFAPPHDNTHTIGSIACGQETIAVGSYDAHRPDTPLSWFSSAGPTRDGREKPDLSAPGHDVFAANSGSTSGVFRTSGTSMAAPAVTGVIALFLAALAKAGVELSAADIRKAFIAAARRNPPAGAGWHPRYGYGRLGIPSVPVVTLPTPRQRVLRAPKPKRKKEQDLVNVADAPSRCYHSGLG